MVEILRDRMPVERIYGGHHVQLREMAKKSAAHPLIKQDIEK